MSVRQTRKSKLAAAVFFKRVVRGQNARDGKPDTPVVCTKSAKHQKQVADDQPPVQPTMRGRKRKLTTEHNEPNVCEPDVPSITGDCNKNCLKGKKLNSHSKSQQMSTGKQKLVLYGEATSKKRRLSPEIGGGASGNACRGMMSNSTSAVNNDNVWSHDKHFTVVKPTAPTGADVTIKSDKTFNVPSTCKELPETMQTTKPSSLCADAKVSDADAEDNKMDSVANSATVSDVHFPSLRSTVVDIEYPCKVMSQVMYLALSGLALSSKVAEMRKNAAGHRLHRNAGGKLRRVLKPCMKPGMVYQPQSPVRSRTQLLTSDQVDSTAKRQLQLGVGPVTAPKAISYLKVPGKSYMKVPDRKRHQHHCESEQIKDKHTEDGNKMEIKCKEKASVKKMLDEGSDSRKTGMCKTAESKGVQPSVMSKGVGIKTVPLEDKVTEGVVEGSRRSARQRDGKRKEWWHLLRAAPDEYTRMMKQSDNTEQTARGSKVKVQQTCKQRIKAQQTCNQLRKPEENVLEDVSVPKVCTRKATAEMSGNRKKKRRRDKSVVETEGKELCNMNAVDTNPDSCEKLLLEQVKLVNKDVIALPVESDTRLTSDGRVIPNTNMYECIIPHMCNVCWINDHMYCRHMKRVARDLPPCGGCIHYMPCTHFRQLREGGGVYARGGRPLKVETPRCASDLLCHEEMPESDSDGAGSPGGVGTELLHIELRARRAQLAAAAHHHSSDPEGPVTVADYAAEVIVSDLAQQESPLVSQSLTKAESRVRPVQALPGKFCIRVHEKSGGRPLGGQGVVKVERLGEGRFLLEANGVDCNEPPEEVHITLAAQHDGQMYSDVVGEVIAQQALNLVSAPEIRPQLLILTPCYPQTRRRDRKRRVDTMDQKSRAVDLSAVSQYPDECSRLTVAYREDGSQYVECSSVNNCDNSRTVMPLVMDTCDEKPIDLRVGNKGEASAYSSDENTLHFTTHDIWRRLPRLITRLKQCNMWLAIRKALKAEENNISNALATNNSIVLGMKEEVEQKQCHLNALMSAKLAAHDDDINHVNADVRHSPEEIFRMISAEEDEIRQVKNEIEVILQLLKQMLQEEEEGEEAEDTCLIVKLPVAAGEDTPHTVSSRHSVDDDADQLVPAVIGDQHEQITHCVTEGVTAAVPTVAHTLPFDNYAIHNDCKVSFSTHKTTCSNDDIKNDISSMPAREVYNKPAGIPSGIRTANVSYKSDDTTVKSSNEALLITTLKSITKTESNNLFNDSSDPCTGLQMTSTTVEDTRYSFAN